MELDYSLPNLLILFGALQGIILSSILLLKKKSKAHLSLGIFILALSYNAFETFTAASGLGSKIVFFDLFGFTTIFLLGPSLYLYIQSVLFPEKTISKKALRLHLLLPVFQLSVNIALISTYLLNSRQIIKADWDFSMLYGLFDTYSEPLSIVVFSAYIIYAFKEYRRAYKTEKQLAYPNSLKKTVLQLTRTLLITMSIFSAIWLTVFCLAIFSSNNPELNYYPIEIPLIFFIYWASFAIHQKMQSLQDHLNKSKQSLISQAEASLVMTQLKDLMQETQLYLNPKITRELVATKAQISPRYFSSILNQYHGQSFNDFINGYRVEEVKTQLHSTQFNTKTITGIALDAGFNSQATFQRVFKKHVGMSPRAYAVLQPKKNNQILLKTRFE